MGQPKAADCSAAGVQQSREQQQQQQQHQQVSHSIVWFGPQANCLAQGFMLS
jgi:hypothetical protein